MKSAHGEGEIAETTPPPTYVGPPPLARGGKESLCKQRDYLLFSAPSVEGAGAERLRESATFGEGLLERSLPSTASKSRSPSLLRGRQGGGRKQRGEHVDMPCDNRRMWDVECPRLRRARRYAVSRQSRDVAPYNEVKRATTLKAKFLCFEKSLCKQRDYVL